MEKKHKREFESCESTNHASRELERPQTVFWRFFGRHLTKKPCVLQLLQALKPADQSKPILYAEDYAGYSQINKFLLLCLG